jgi:hypothetical protein
LEKERRYGQEDRPPKWNIDDDSTIQIDEMSNTYIDDDVDHLSHPINHFAIKAHHSLSCPRLQTIDELKNLRDHQGQ